MMLLPLLLGLAPAVQAQGPPLLAVPEGWRHERLEFPLSFAPELKFRGFEDLSFAPGMFQRDSDSYFSYALALRLEGDVEMGERELTRILEVYYGGLYRAVAGERALPTEDRATRVAVRRDGADFTATVRTFDAFTTGADLSLELELSVHSAPRATEVLGLASPKPADAPIWKELRAIGAAWRSARPAPVFLNHVYAVVDRETYDAMVHSDFLCGSFAVTEERATKRADISYSGLYFYGRRTYFEFLPPQPAAGLAEGNCGLGFGLERPGALEEFAARLAQREIASQSGPRTRELDGEQLPWFRIQGVSMPPSPLGLFAMEYEPAFLARWHAALPPLGGGIARAGVLARYAASLKKAELHAAGPFEDVRSVTLEANAAQCERLLVVFAAAGYEISTGEGSWDIQAPQYRLLLRKTDGPGRIAAIELDLRAEVQREPLQFGRATLSFSGKTARFEMRK